MSTLEAAPPTNRQSVHSIGAAMPSSLFQGKSAQNRKIKQITQTIRLGYFGGGRWIRTTEGIASRFTVCPIWPLWNSPILTCVGAGGRIRTPDLLITNVGRNVKVLISGAFLSFRVGDSAVYEPAASIQYIRSYYSLGHGLGQTILLGI